MGQWLSSVNIMAAARPALLSVEFEVFGKVQGVFFRKYTQKKAVELGLVGWVQNTNTGTVIGHVRGPAEKVKDMKSWLSTKGSPKSRIDKFESKNEKNVEKKDFREFRIKH